MNTNDPGNGARRPGAPTFHGRGERRAGRPALAPGAGIRPPPEGPAPSDPYGDLAKPPSSENPHDPSGKAPGATTAAWKHSNRSGYPDRKIADRHDVGADRIMPNAGSGETLRVAGPTCPEHDEKVVRVLLADRIRDIDDRSAVAKRRYRDFGPIRLRNPQRFDRSGTRRSEARGRGRPGLRGSLAERGTSGP